MNNHWPDSKTFWRDKRVIVNGDAFEISIKDLLEIIARLTGFEGEIV